MSSKVQSEEVNVAVRLPIQTSRRIVRQAAASAVRRLIPERWIVDLLFIAAALLAGATALGGLAILSSGTPATNPAFDCLGTCRRHTAEPVAFDVWNDPACCEEVR